LLEPWPPFRTAEELTERAYGSVRRLAGARRLRRGAAAALRRAFYFGCEADDPITAWAFDKHGQHRLRPIFSSDVGHFDVVDMSEVLEEAWELVEHGLLTEEDFRDFVFANPVRLHTALNPDFFKGTAVESAAARLRAG
jgi:hypothetical protein